jgi:hypothetical protein
LLTRLETTARPQRQARLESQLLTPTQTQSATAFCAIARARFEIFPAFFLNESLQSLPVGQNFRAFSGKRAVDSIGKGSVR